MKVTSNTVSDLLLRTRSYFQGDESSRKYTYEAPLRAELYSSDQMEQRGRAVAKLHKLVTGKAPNKLLGRLADNEKILIEVRDLLAEALKQNRRITPAGEWLLDNFYLIEEQIILAKKHFPKGYSMGLPRLATGPSEGLPRVYDIALEIISHSDGRVDLNSLTGFVAAYQQIQKLSIGELWAIPIMLRLALIENLRRVAARIAMDKIDQNLANYWAEQMMKMADENPKDIIILLADMARSNPPLDSPFVAEINRKLLGKGPTLAMALTWMEQQLSDRGISSSELVHFENQKQAADQVSVSNSIGSLKFLGGTDWREFVETVSGVDEILREDLNDVYGRMDFATRDTYRHVIERIAKHSEYNEQEIAAMAVNMAKAAATEEGMDSRKAHVGYFLIDKGLPLLQKAAAIRFTLLTRWQYYIASSPLTFYLGSILILTLLFSSGIALATYQTGVQGWLLVLLMLFVVIAISQLAMMMVNWASTQVVRPETLPRMEYSRGIPSEARSIVVIPTMLTSERGLNELIEGLEVRFLANNDHHLHFALLTDFADAPAENMPDDEALLTLAKTRITELNLKYRRMHSDIFFYFHRPRKWNPKEKVWMGYERKRGKLSELNQLLRGNGRENFSLIMGDTSVFPNIKYVITLDTDTQLPRDTAWKFVATMAHPLNHAVYSEAKRRIIDGYGILQPRVAVSLLSPDSSIYEKMHANDTGLDPYTRVVSDVYQDIFREGSFIGKGIYDIDVFEKVLHDRFPENRILSHDLVEGNYVRSGLMSDVQVYEENPSRYSADVKRRHRWIRGDWQIAGWMLPWVPVDKSGKLTKNTLSILARWKIFDNIRRSFVSVSMVALLLLGWVVIPHPWLITAVITAILFIPLLITAGWHLINKPRNMDWQAHANDVLKGVKASIFGTVFEIACMPYEAMYTMDAIIRTSWRMLISKKGLLEWTPSGSQKFSNKQRLDATFLRMWIGPAIAIAVFAYLVMYDLRTLIYAMPFLILWMCSPFFAWYISEPVKKKVAAITEEQRIYLHKLSRKTWAFFERFVGPTDNWLPPDNFQEQPDAKIAHRTSPTNMGLSLLASLSAYDFGYITAYTAAERIEHSLSSMNDLERYMGHFYNWYDTETKAPLLPRYVSSVDSGNLAGHLLTLRQGLLGMIDAPIILPQLFRGLRDTCYLISDSLKDNNDPALKALEQVVNQYYDERPVLLGETNDALYNILAAAKTLKEVVAISNNPLAYEWTEQLINQVNSTFYDIHTLVPYSLIPERPYSLTGTPFMLTLPTLSEIANDLRLPEHLEAADNKSPEELAWIKSLSEKLELAKQQAAKRIQTLKSLANIAAEMADMEYDFLYDKSKSLLRIGYNVDEQHRDASYYDLLASEARLGSFVAISQGKLPQENWFALGRLLTNTGGDPVLLSWSGSMFEYLMPMLVMPSYENTLLDQTHKATVKRQIAYGRQRSVPWGISEAGYNAVDAALNYQYRAFGVPGLGLKRGLGDDLVIAPYATMMALMVDPAEATRNLQTMSDMGFEGKYGFFEAIDYTPSRIPRGQQNAIVRSFMVHHQGMGLLSLAYLLLDQPMQRRFEAEPQLQATLLLLQEKVPKNSLYYTHNSDVIDTHHENSVPEIRIINTPDTPNPEVQLLTNSKYQVVITNSGGGYSRWKDISVTRWREDSTMDNWGVFCYIKDLSTGEYWSNTYQPTLKQARNYEAVFSQGHAEFHRRDDSIDTRTEVVVSPEDDIEIRRVRISNRSQTTRVLEITSYAEVVLAPQGADTAHPAFSNLFVQTEIQEHHPAIICTRRARSSHETPPWMVHQMSVTGATVEEVSYETDRMKFIGRGNTPADPAAVINGGTLSGSQGSVLDPIVAIRYKIILKPGQTAIVDMVIGMGEQRDTVVGLMEKYHDRHLKNRAFELSWTHSQVLLRQINATEADAQLYGRLASTILYSNPYLRADPFIIKSNHKGQSGLWSYSISGDLPIVLLRVNDSENVELVQQMIQAHAYWRLKGLAVDLVIWNEDHGSYRQVLHDQILGMVNAVSTYTAEKPGGVFVRSADQISNEDRILFQTVARAIIYDNRGSLKEQINKKPAAKAIPPAFKAITTHVPAPIPEVVKRHDLLFDNGYGGFSPDGKEYIITTSKDLKTPVPWVNVIANKEFGTVISESGMAYSWAENAHEFRLTPWHNDPVSDRGGEAYYLRDEESGYFWSPTPLPVLGQGTYTTRHGFGYSIFEHEEDGIQSQLTTFVGIDVNVKFMVIKVKNNSGRARKLSATGYVEWVLGDQKPKAQMHVITELDTATGAVFAQNRYNTAFADRYSFFDTDDTNRTLTGDRDEFIGRNRSLQNPAAMHRTKLSGRTGSRFDPCTAMQVIIDLEEGEEKEVIFRLGTARHLHLLRELIQQSKGSTVAANTLKKVKEYWNDTLGAVQVQTPDKALNVLANGWLPYQTLACRIWARSGYYQSGGAYGFRDQLQDVLSLIHTKPELAREQILLCASRQFKEGDVQHWWHPPLGRGVRTRCSDDFLWLPFATARYILGTNDLAVLQQPVTYLEGRVLNDGEESYYDLPNHLEISETLYEHCVAAIRHGFRWGSHGLPLIGSGDWNDGMDRVGIDDKGESIWLGFFFYDVLMRFRKVAELKGDTAFAEECVREAKTLQDNLEKNGWDGDWYRRAYYDDGTPLGSQGNDECRIDSISQSWSVLSGAGKPERSLKGMNAVDKHLVRRDLGLIQLLDPPFDKSKMNPGYIKGYVPGVRENGGQYTHAAIWTIMAFAELGDHEKAWELFSLINPVNHGNTAEKISIYKAEPYVAAADIYAVEPHGGRGGWTWYTGSAGWMNYLILDSILGLKMEANRLHIKPCIPAAWDGYKVSYRHKTATYHIEIKQPVFLKEETVMRVDGEVVTGEVIDLLDDGNAHEVEVIMGISVIKPKIKH